MKAQGYPGVDPWVVDWFEQNGAIMDSPPDGCSAEYLAAARPPTTVFPISVPIASVTAEVISDVPVWINEHDGTPTGVIVYAHGGGFTTGSPELMDPIARELAACSGAAVVSVDYGLAPERPYPAGLNDLAAAIRWVVDHAEVRFRSPGNCVAVAGESAGGNLSAAVTLKLRDEDGPTLAAQVLLYPCVASRDAVYPSRSVYDGLVLSYAASRDLWDIYSGGTDLSKDPYAVPLIGEDLSGLPPALVTVGGCDWLRDEGLEYAARLCGAGIPTTEVNVAGQPHGFINLMFPAAAEVYEAVGPWLRARFADRATRSASDTATTAVSTCSTLPGPAASSRTKNAEAP